MACLKGSDEIMYFVDREKIESTLQFIEKQLNLLEITTKWESVIEKAALERICHTTIEGILDVGNAMIDGFIMRDPGSYEDIIDILMDEKVVSEKTGAGLKAVILYRKNLVQEYAHVNHREMLNALSQYREELRSFAPNVREYLNNELGVVTAFRN